MLRWNTGQMSVLSSFSRLPFLTLVLCLRGVVNGILHSDTPSDQT